MRDAEADRQEHERACQQLDKSIERLRPYGHGGDQRQRHQRHEQACLLGELRFAPREIKRQLAPLRSDGRGGRCLARQFVRLSHLCSLAHMIFLPSADRIISTASCAVWFCVSKSGLTSVSSTETTRPESAIFSIARWPSR